MVARLAFCGVIAYKIIIKRILYAIVFPMKTLFLASALLVVSAAAGMAGEFPNPYLCHVNVIDGDVCE